jgi:hypothetical protein
MRSQEEEVVPISSCGMRALMNSKDCTVSTRRVYNTR